MRSQSIPPLWTRPCEQESLLSTRSTNGLGDVSIFLSICRSAQMRSETSSFESPGVKLPPRLPQISKRFIHRCEVSSGPDSGQERQLGEESRGCASDSR